MSAWGFIRSVNLSVLNGGVKKLLDNFRRSPYHSIVGVLGLKFIFNLVLSDKSTV
jgi:hypothetical protein